MKKPWENSLYERYFSGEIGNALTKLEFLGQIYAQKVELVNDLTW